LDKSNKALGSNRLTSLLSSPLSKRDNLILKNKSLYVKCSNGFAKLLPPFKKNTTIVLGNKKIEIVIKEITNPKEIQGYEYLRKFHYRNNGNSFGRQAILVAALKSVPFTVLGFIQISSPPILNKARANFLDTKFCENSIGWTSWDKQTSIKYSKLIAEISRVVVHPEYRNLGIAQELLKSSFLYARDYWQIGNIKPLFVEITADMLKFIPFTEKAGMMYIGDTEGNLYRLKRDLAYYFKNGEKVKGNLKNNCMVRLQKKSLRKANEILKNNNICKEDLLAEISRLSKENIYKKYGLLGDILRLPKPVYLYGLTKSAQNFLIKRQKELNLMNKPQEHYLGIEPLRESIKIVKVSVSFLSSVPRTKRTSLVQESFGVNPDSIESLVFHDLSMEIVPGEIILIVGASGSGKTTLLRLVKGEVKPTKGNVFIPSNAKLGFMEPISSSRPLIEEVGSTINKSLYILNKVGLSDFSTYLLRYDQLSTGQQYRAQLAKLIDSGSNVWVLDNFLSNLDKTTSMIIANNIQKIARKLSVTLIVACCDCEHFIDALKPDKILLKEYGWSYRLFERKYKDITNEPNDEKTMSPSGYAVMPATLAQ